MTLRPPMKEDRQDNTGDGQYEQLLTRLAQTEHRLRQVENALKGIARHTGEVSVAGPCMCGESLLLVKQTVVYCPACGHQQAL